MNKKQNNTQVRFIFSIVLLALMMGILTILNVSDRALKDAEKERGISEAREQIQLDIKLLQKASDPEIQLGSYFSHVFSAKSQRIGENSQWKELLHNYMQRLVPSGKSTPGWFLYDFSGSRKSSGEEFMGDELHNTFIGGKPLQFSSEIIRMLCFKGVNGISNRPIDHSAKIYMYSFLDTAIDEKAAKNQTSFIRSAMGSFQEVYIEKKLHYFAWFPLFKENWSSAQSRFDKVDLKKFDARELSLLHLKGVAAVVFDESGFLSARKDLLLKALKQNFSRNNCHLSFRTFASLSIGEREAFQQPTMKLLSNGDLVATSKIYAGEDLLVIALRKTDFAESSVRKSASIGFCMKLVWVACGFLFIGNFLIMRRKVSQRLSFQLTVFMTWILFPAFYLGFNATERYVLEKQTASLTYLRNGLEELVVAFDGSIELYRTWVCDTIFRTIDQSMETNKIELSSMTEESAKKVYSDLQKELLRNGVFTKNISLVDSRGRIFSLMQRAEAKFFQSFFNAFYLPVIKEENRIPQNSKGARGDLVMDVQAEEIVTMIRSVLPAKNLSDMAIKPVSLDQLEGFGDQAQVYHRYLGKGNIARAIVQVGIDLPSIERNCMIDWVENFSQEKFENIVWLISRNDHPGWFLRPPFWKTVTAGKMGLLTPVYDFLPSDLLFWNLVGTRSREPIVTVINFAGEKWLLASIPGKHLPDYKVCTMIPLKKYFAGLNEFRLRLLLAMAAIFFVCSLIGVRLSGGFIRPVRSLAENAEKLMAGDLSVRLPVDWEDSEINSLSNNFNLVAANVETGKTLKKFVSEGALRLIQVGDKILSAENIKSEMAVILFLRLDHFWECAARLSPEKAVFELNRFFSLVCREVKNAGGDVNKFIGEKALAVFQVNELNSLTNVARASVKVATRLVELTSQKKGIFADCPIRIGMTAGKVLSGVIGGEKTRLEQTVVGDVVNLASRLCTFESEERILLNSDLALIVQEIKSGESDFSIVRLPEQKIKGKKQLVSIFAVRGKGTQFVVRN